MSTTEEPAEVVTAQPVAREPSREIVHSPGGHVAAREVRMDVIRPLNPAAVVESMREHQSLLQAILDRSDWQGEPGATGSFVKKSGWRKIALAYNLTMERVGEEVEYDATGMPTRATYTARAIAPNGRGVEATGHCAEAESRFAKDAARHKLENDMRATAETRAKNRAISDLIGMGKVSAEEAESGGGGGPPWGAAADEANTVRARNAALYLLGGKEHGDTVDAMLEAWAGVFGYVPAPMTYGVIDLAMKVREIATAPVDVPLDVEHLTPEQEAELAARAEAAGVEPVEADVVDDDAPTEPLEPETLIDVDPTPVATDAVGTDGAPISF